MNAVHPTYMCQCRVPDPLIYIGEDTGLCKSCSFVYDERLYEMRLRQHTAHFTFESVDEFLTEIDPAYRALAG